MQENARKLVFKRIQHNKIQQNFEINLDNKETTQISYDTTIITEGQNLQSDKLENKVQEESGKYAVLSESKDEEIGNLKTPIYVRVIIELKPFKEQTIQKVTNIVIGFLPTSALSIDISSNDIVIIVPETEQKNLLRKLKHIKINQCSPNIISQKYCDNLSKSVRFNDDATIEHDQNILQLNMSLQSLF
ncbi:Hypothetical_protein [Hexamita inflata]|uniref:Hypothetical_protein n=1 Tax=Hexamita inflata TaxID=28002 RepID=A0AA86TTQ4_9EUKA|nr:Hypothetical protein HINF_LOCUS15780 [Hexamita inflata]